MSIAASTYVVAFILLGAPSQTSPVSARATRGRRGTDAQRPATPVTTTADESDREGEQTVIKAEEDNASIADSTQQTEIRSTRATRASKLIPIASSLSGYSQPSIDKRKTAEMDQDSPVETTRSKRKAGEKTATAEQEEPRRF